MSLQSQIKRAVVTGASGFIGQNLVRKLIELGIETIAVVRQNNNPSLASDVRVLPLGKPRVLDDLLSEGDVIFHLAAHANVADSVADPLANFDNNVPILLHTLESARKKGARFIFPSTGSIFDSSLSLPLSEKSYVHPHSPYGAAKLSGEAYSIAYYHSYGVDTRIVRLFSLYGPGMRQLVVRDLYEKIKNNSKELTLMGDGRQVRDYLHVDDAVKGLIQIASHGSPGEDYNLASGEPTKIEELARLIAKIMGFPAIHLNFTGKFQPGEVRQWYADISKVKNIHFIPSIALPEGLEQTLAWFDSHL